MLHQIVAGCLKSNHKRATCVSTGTKYFWAQTPLSASGWRDMTSMPERRRHPRFTALLPLRVKVVGGIVEPNPAPLVTQNLSKTGLCFPSPRRIEPSQSIEVEVIFLGAGLGGNNISVSSTGYIVRAESTRSPGWYRLAAAFNETPSGDERDWQRLVAAFEKKL